MKTLRPSQRTLVSHLGMDAVFVPLLAAELSAIARVEFLPTVIILYVLSTARLVVLWQRRSTCCDPRRPSSNEPRRDARFGRRTSGWPTLGFNELQR